MRSIKRFSEPSILCRRKKDWITKFLKSRKKRPDSNKYAHKEIRDQLDSMSYHKCFYCETKLKGGRKEVDHHIEVSIDKKLAFEWNNLYLACDNCNGKINHVDIPIQDALDPCKNDDLEIQENLTFNKELIEPNNNSSLGLKTIQKYRLNKEILDTRRLKELSIFHEVVLEIQKRRLDENGRALKQQEIDLINSFKRPDSPYSLMFKVLLDKCSF